VSKANKAGPAAAAKAPPVGEASHRLNPRALVVVLLVVVLAGAGFVGLRFYRGRAGLTSYLAEAKKAVAEKRYDMALTYVNTYLQGHPKSLEALEIKGKVLADLVRDFRTLEEALRVQTQILSLEPTRMDARKRLIELNLRGGPTLARAAHTAAQEYLNRGADDAEAHRLMAMALEGVGRLGDVAALDAAVDEYEKAEKLKPGDVGAGLRLAYLYLERGKELTREKRAVEVLDKMLEANPNSVAARLARFNFFSTHPELFEKENGAARRIEKENGAAPQKSEYDKAVAAHLSLPEYELAEARRIAPGNADARIYSADLALRQGDTPAARAHLAAIDPPPKDDPRLNLLVSLLKGQIDFQEQRPDEGIQSWRAGLIQTGGTDADLHWKLARVLIGLNRIGEARQHMLQYRRLVGGTAPNPEYRYLDALIALRAGRVKEALPELEAIRNKVPARSPLAASQLLISLGDAYAASRDQAKAIDAYTQATTAAGAGPQPWQSMARLHLIAERPADAVAALEKGLASNPGDLSLLVALAQSLRAQELAKPKDRRDWGEFNRRLAEAERRAPDAPEVALTRADYLADSGQLDEALKRIEAAVARSPTAVGPWLARAAALVRLGRADDAVKVLDEATKAAGDNAQFRVTKARFLLRLGEPGPAYEVLEEGLNRLPVDQKPLLCRAKGEYFQERGDANKARAAYEEWARLQPEAVEPRVALLNLASTMKDGPAMEAQAAAIARIAGPDSVTTKITRADVLLALMPAGEGGRSDVDKARLDEAGRLVEEIKAATPGQAAGFLIEAQLMGRLGRVDAQIAAYKAALELRGGTAALRPLVALLSAPGREREFEEFHKKVPNLPVDLEQTAIAIALQRGDAVKAEQMVDEMLRGNPQALDVAVWKAKILNTLGKPAEAENLLRVLVQQQPDNPSAWVQLMMFQASRGEADKARATLEQMKQKKLATDRPELLWAVCYRALNMRAEADAAFAKAVERSPDDPGVHQALVDYCESTGRPDEAVPSLRHLLKIRPGFEWARRRLALNLSARPNDPEALAEAMSLVGVASPGESPDDRKLRAVIYSRNPDPKRRAEAIVILEALAAELPEPESSRLYETLAVSLANSAEQAKAAGDTAQADADRARALEHAARAARPEGAAPDVILFHAGLLLRGGDVAGAEKDLARLEKSDPKALPTIELRSRILNAKGDGAAAEKLISDTFEARKAAPDALAVGLGLLKLLIVLDRPAAAEKLGAALAGINAQGRIAYAEFLAGRGRAADAQAQFAAAAADGRAADAARVVTALAGDRGGEWIVHADSLLSSALKAQPDSVDLLLAQAYLLHLRGDYKGEIALYERVLAGAPPTYLFLNNMAWTLSEELGRPEEGLKRIDEGIRRVGRQSHLVDTRGVILLRLGRDTEAVKELEDAAVLLPTGPIYFHLARAYKKMGREADFEKARDQARKAGLKPDRLQPSERDEAEKLVGFADATPAAGGPAAGGKP
jgi:tetratricopeptide (TPR) repeat protein